MAEFNSGAFRDQPDTLPGITTPQLILIAARSLESPEIKGDAIGSFDQLAWTRGGLEAVVQDLELTPTEAFVLSRMHGHTRLEQLQRLCSLPDAQFLAAIYALRTAGLIQIGDTPDLTPAVAPEPTPAPKPATEATEVTGTERRERERVLELASKVRRFNHYQALGLSPAAGPATVESAWDSYRRRFNPDRAATTAHLKGLESELRAVYERAEEAYYVLSKASSRERYDQILRSLDTDNEEEGQLQRSSQIKARNELIAANLQRAEQLERSGEIYAAIQMLSQVCDLDPQPETLLRLARLYLRNPLWAKKALEALKKVLELDPDYIEAWVELAEFWRRRGNRERQRKALERALAAHPDHERAAEMYRQLAGRRELDRLLKRARRR
jgi:tetratricopeptide (TPR) repeat protein